MQNFVRQWTKKSTGQCVRWFEKSTGQFKKPPAFVRFPVLNTTPDTYLFIKNGTLDFANKIKTIDPTGLIFSGIHIYPMLHVSCKFGNDIQKNKVIATIFVKDTKSGRI